MSSLREQLAKKRAHSTSLTFPIGEEGEHAKAELDAAENNERVTKAVAKGEDADELTKRAVDRTKKARRTYDKHSITIEFRGLTEDERDALLSAHPVTDEQKAKDAEAEIPAEQRSEINGKTFLPAALALVTLDSDLSEEDWAAELSSDRWTAGEKASLMTAVLTATNAQPGPGVGKGSATTR